MLRHTTEMSAFIMLTVADETGTVLSDPARTFDTSERPVFTTERIGRRSSAQWRVPVSAQLAAGAIPQEGLKGTLVVNVALTFAKVSSDARPADSAMESSLLTLYDTDIPFTQAALSEGAEHSTPGR